MKYKTVEELEAAIEDYFDRCDNRTIQVFSQKTGVVAEIVDPAPYTMSGLAYAMGVDRKTLLNYSNRQEYFPTIKKARDKVQEDVETRLMEGKAVGAIFNLKNNFDWKDKSELDLSNQDGTLNPYSKLTPDELRKLAK